MSTQGAPVDDRTRTALGLARRAVERAGHDAGDGAILRVASSVLVEFPTAALVARVDTPAQAARASDHVRIARFLEERGVPAVRSIDSPASVARDPRGVVTLWRRVTFEERSPSAEELARAARALHDSTRDGPEDLPSFDPFDGVADWLDRPVVRASKWFTELREQVDRRRTQWAERLPDASGEAVIHGDLNLDNVVITADGPVLLDLECTGIGPVSWDLVAPWVSVRRYGGPLEWYERFASAYGADVRQSASCQLFCDVYETCLAVWCLAHADLSAEMSAEAEIRLRTLLDGSTAKWSLV